MPKDRRTYLRAGGIVVLGVGLVGGLLALSASPEAAGQTPAGSQATTSQATPGSSSSVIDDNTIAAINEHIEKGWKDNGITPSNKATYYEFLRRVYLDVIGRVPTTEEISIYQKRLAKNKSDVTKTNAEEIEYLLTTTDYAENWANLWTVWLLTRTSPNGIDREALRLWLEECFALNKPYDKMFEEILTATGKANESGPANFILSHPGERTPQNKRQRDGMYEMVPATARTARLFLGHQVQCTQCHDHPFIDSRKQSQYWAVNAYFRQVERDEVPQNRQGMGQFMTLRDNLDTNPEGGVYYERRNGTLLWATPMYLDGKTKLTDFKANRRVELAKLITRDEQFAKAFANRMWGHFMGRGFVHPVDDFGEHNPCSHPELLDRLAKDFAASGFDQRRVIRWITNSKPYQLTSVSNDTNKKQDADPYFSRMLLKSMTPEQLVDSIFTATNAEKTKSTKEEKRKLYDDWLRDFTVNFGDDEGNEATFNGTVVQALLLMNGGKLNDALKRRSGSTIDKAMQNPSPPNRLNYLYLSALGRPPTAAESRVAFLIPRVTAKPEDGGAPWEDIFWALLNSNEFILNH